LSDFMDKPEPEQPMSYSHPADDTFGLLVAEDLSRVSGMREKLHTRNDMTVEERAELAECLSRIEGLIRRAARRAGGRGYRVGPL
jgi:hypothetical protein